VNECEIQRAVEEHRRLIHPVDALHLDGDLGVSEVECSDHAADRIADEETDRERPLALSGASDPSACCIGRSEQWTRLVQQLPPGLGELDVPARAHK
jgi:hypothetical protein